MARRPLMGICKDIVRVPGGEFGNAKAVKMRNRGQTLSGIVNRS
jgi:hypothetical protein